jgi:hypothetical protein
VTMRRVTTTDRSRPPLATSSVEWAYVTDTVYQQLPKELAMDTTWAARRLARGVAFDGEWPKEV